MKTFLSADSLRELNARLQKANNEFAAKYPGETGHRQPVHTVYGGAHLFKSDTTPRLGGLARRALLSRIKRPKFLRYRARPVVRIRTRPGLEQFWFPLIVIALRTEVKIFCTPNRYSDPVRHSVAAEQRQMRQPHRIKRDDADHAPLHRQKP